MQKIVINDKTQYIVEKEGKQEKEPENQTIASAMERRSTGVLEKKKNKNNHKKEEKGGGKNLKSELLRKFITQM